MTYTNTYKGRANRKESADHLRLEFDRIETAFTDLHTVIANSYSANYVNTPPGGGTLTIDPANGVLQEVTLTETTLIEILTPVSNNSVSLLIHGSFIRIINGWGPQTWKEPGQNDGLWLRTGTGDYASALLEFVWDGLAWTCVACSKNDNIVLSATQAQFPFLNNLTDTASAETLGLTRTGPAAVWDSREAWHVLPPDTARFAGSRMVKNWISEPSNLQGVGWKAVNVTVATESGAGPSSEDVDKITFDAVDGEIQHWVLPDFGRSSTSSDPMKFILSFKGKMFSGTSGIVRSVVALMGKDSGSTIVWERTSFTLTDSWQTFGAVFTIATGYDLSNVGRTLTKLAFESPAGSTGSPVLITDVSLEILRNDALETPGEFQESSIGSTITLAKTSGSTGTWDNGTKTLTLTEGQYVDFQDSLSAGDSYLCVPVLTGDTADVLMESDQTYWKANVNSDTMYVSDVPFSFQYNGGVFKFKLVTGVSSSYVLNIYKISSNLNAYATQSASTISNGVVTFATGDPVTSNIFSGLIYENSARANILSSSEYRDFTNWTKVNLSSEGIIDAYRGEYGIDGYPSHGSILQASKGLVNGYFEINATIPNDSKQYAFSIFVRNITDLSGDSVYTLQHDGVTTPESRYYDISVKLTGGTTEIGGQLIRWGAFLNSAGQSSRSDPSVHDYDIVTAIGYNKSGGQSSWLRPEIALTNNGTGNTNCRIRIYPAPGPSATTGVIDNTTTGYLVADWAQLEEVVTALPAASGPIPGGETRGADVLSTSLADGTLYDSNETDVGDITSSVFSFDSTNIYKNISWSTEVVASIGPTNVHDFGTDEPACVDTWQDEDGNPITDENSNDLCTESNNSDSTRIDDLIYYADFEATTYGDPNTSGFWLVQQEYGAGSTKDVWVVRVAGSSAFAEEGMHDNLAMSFGTGGLAHRYRLVHDNGADDISVISPAWTTDLNTIVMFIYVPSTASTQTFFSADRTSSGNRKGPQISIKTDGTIEYINGDGSTIETIISTQTVSVGEWNLIAIKHDPSAKKIGFSINAATTEETTYTLTWAATGSFVSIGAGQTTNGFNNGMVAGTKIQNFIVFDTYVSDSLLSEIYNGGAGLTAAQYFSTETDWPGGSRLTTKPRPEAHYYIPHRHSTFKTAAADEAERADTNDDIVKNLYSVASYPGRMGAIAGGYTYKTGIQNGLAVLRYVTEQVYTGLAWTSTDNIDGSDFLLTAFFAGSCHTTSRGVIFRFGGSLSNPQPRLVTKSDGVIGLWDGTTEWWAGDAVGENNFFIGAVVYNSAGTGSIRLFMNGVLSTTYSNVGVDWEQSGSDFNNMFNDSAISNVDVFKGDLGELILYNSVLSDSEVINIMKWMNDKWLAY